MCWSHMEVGGQSQTDGSALDPEAVLFPTRAFRLGLLFNRGCKEVLGLKLGVMARSMLPALTQRVGDVKGFEIKVAHLDQLIVIVEIDFALSYSVCLYFVSHTTIENYLNNSSRDLHVVLFKSVPVPDFNFQRCGGEIAKDKLFIELWAAVLLPVCGGGGFKENNSGLRK